MSHKHRAAIGRESSRPASRGILAYPKPRRRNCRRSISLAARTRVGNSAFCTLLGATKSVWPAGDQAGWCCRLIGRHACARVCGAITYRTKHTGAAPQCLLAKAPKGTKNAFVPRRLAGSALRRPRRRRISWEKDLFSSYGRDTAFGRTRQVSEKPKHCILESRFLRRLQWRAGTRRLESRFSYTIC